MAKKSKREDDQDGRYRQILFELMHLKEKDYDAFMEKLYAALSGEFRGMVHDSSPVEEKLKALWSMIHHFESKEEYEKCAELKKMTEELDKTN